MLCFAKGLWRVHCFAKNMVWFVTVYFRSATKFPLSVTQTMSSFLCLQVTHIELHRRDCGTGSLPLSLDPLPVLSIEAMIIS